MSMTNTNVNTNVNTNTNMNSSQDIINSLQSLQALEKQLHNQLNESLINSSISAVTENVYVGNSSEKTKTVDMPSNISFTNVSEIGYVPSGSDMIASANNYMVKITNNNGSQQLTVTGDNEEGWSEQLYFKGTGYLGSSKSISSQAASTKTSQKELIDKINDVSNARVAMFRSLNQMYDNSVRSSVNSRNDLVHQITALKLVEDELKNAKRHINRMKEDRDNKLRMAELNMYQSDRFDAYVKFLKLVLFVVLPTILIYVLLNIQFFTSPESDSSLRLVMKDLLIIVMAAFLVYGTYRIIISAYDLSMRNNMNFNSYDFAFDQGDVGVSVIQYDEEQDKKIEAEFDADVGDVQRGVSNLGKVIQDAGCIGQECCASGTIYNKQKHKCIVLSK